MARRRKLKGVKKHRRVGKHTKHNKKSVALRRKLRREKFKKELKTVMEDSKEYLEKLSK